MRRHAVSHQALTFVIAGLLALALPASGLLVVAEAAPALSTATAPATPAIASETLSDWLPTGSLMQGREEHSATRLLNGQVLMAGGENDTVSTETDSAELYNPTTGQWSATGRMTRVRIHHTATLLNNGKVLAAGGADCPESGCYYHDSAELYDPETGIWSSTGSMAQTRSGHTATLLTNGKVLIVGGISGSSGVTAELYDPVTGTWSTTGASLTPRGSGHTATLLPNGTVLVTGGYNRAPFTSAEVYDPQTDTWTATGSMSTERSNHTATLLQNGLVLVAGGASLSGTLASAELYDPETGTWRPTGSMRNGQAQHTATLLNSGAVLVVACNDCLPNNELYDPTTGFWSDAGRTPDGGRVRHTATLLSDGRVLVVGGCCGPQGAETSAVVYLGPQTTLENIWYFAEGYTGPGFDEFLTIVNPSETTAEVRITYYFNDPSTTIEATQQYLSVNANSRLTVAVHETLSGVGRNKEVAAKVQTTNGVGIVVERPMYFTYGAGITGGHTSLGATALHDTWYFAEGYTGAGFDQYLTILNPTNTTATVAITYYLRGGGTVTKNLDVRYHSRRTVAVHETDLGVGRDQEVAAKVEATNGVGLVVERPMYFTYGSGITGGHISLGAPMPRSTWYFAEGYTGAGFDEFLTLANPGAETAQVRITYFLSDGSTRMVTLAVGGTSRATVAVHDAAQGVGRGQAVSAKVESTNGVDIVAERPMYFTYGGNVTGGHAVMGAELPRTTWYLAEGYTGAGFDEYLAIYNPNTSPAEVRITYYLARGTTVSRFLTVGPTTRATVLVHETDLGVGRNQEVAARVTTTNPGGIVVERPMYFTYGAGITDGHATLGYPD